MHRHEIEAYFTRKQREVLITKRMPLNRYTIFCVNPNVDEDHDKAVWSLKQQGWTIAAIARLVNKSWHVADKMVEAGHKKIEEEIGITISTTDT